jgi:hypothetical protein
MSTSALQELNERDIALVDDYFAVQWHYLIRRFQQFGVTHQQITTALGPEHSAQTRSTLESHYTTLS